MHVMRAMLIVIALVAGCGGGASGADCAGLALDDCRLAPGCKVDACEGCSCTPQYRGCIAASRPQAECPALGCPSPQCCGEQADCPDTTACAPPGTALGCGACNIEPNSCADDAACKAQSATAICAPIPCSCDGNNACTQGCTDDTTCAEGARCDLATNRCRATACDDAGDCPANFACADQQCTRMTCTEDAACAGYCVEGSCYSGLGECRPPSA